MQYVEGSATTDIWNNLSFPDDTNFVVLYDSYAAAYNGGAILVDYANKQIIVNSSVITARFNNGMLQFKPSHSSNYIEYYL